jgi:multimeric flavodoxin WrbA
MHILAMNGSPRKKGNTATLLGHALDGARQAGAQARVVHLYDLDYTGCISCFECKKIGGKSYGRCAVKDGLTPLLEEAAQADALILGTPIYFGAESGMTRCFIERLLFPYLAYAPGYPSIFPRKIPTALTYTMNVPETIFAERGYDRIVERLREPMARTFGACEVLLCQDTYQFPDYSKYLCTVWDETAKRKRREEVFPRDCARAQDLGRRLAGGSSA